MIEVRNIRRTRKRTPEETARLREIQKQAEDDIHAAFARRKANEAAGIKSEPTGPSSVFDVFELNHLVSSLREAREEQGLSLADVSARSGLDRSALCRLENYRSINPTFATLTRYAAAVGLRLTLGVASKEPVAAER